MLGVVVQTFNTSTQKAESGLQSKFQDDQGYTEKSSLSLFFLLEKKVKKHQQPLATAHTYTSPVHTKQTIHRPILTATYTTQYTHWFLCKILSYRRNQGLVMKWPIGYLMFQVSLVCISFLCALVCVDMCTTVCICRSQDSLWKSVLPLCEP